MWVGHEGQNIPWQHGWSGYVRVGVLMAENRSHFQSGLRLSFDGRHGRQKVTCCLNVRSIFPVAWQFSTCHLQFALTSGIALRLTSQAGRGARGSVQMGGRGTLQLVGGSNRLKRVTLMKRVRIFLVSAVLIFAVT